MMLSWFSFSFSFSLLVLYGVRAGCAGGGEDSFSLRGLVDIGRLDRRTAPTDRTGRLEPVQYNFLGRE
jgi:hypothetical protein